MAGVKNGVASEGKGPAPQEERPAAADSIEDLFAIKILMPRDGQAQEGVERVERSDGRNAAGDIASTFGQRGEHTRGKVQRARRVHRQGQENSPTEQ